MLYIVATPIGHLEDISQRALKTLQTCDAILCEDTRRSAILLERYAIRKPLISYHKFKEQKSLEKILDDLEAGKNLALISDAGTPCLADPGGRLVTAAIDRGLPFTAIPGPCSIIQALVLSGFEIDRFQFIGFLPKQPNKALRQTLCYPGVTVAFESPQRVLRTLNTLLTLDPGRKIAVAREMTKTFEECVRGTVTEVSTHFQKTEPKGEIVLVIAPGNPIHQQLDLEECVTMLCELHGLSLKDAIKQAARFLNTPKSVVYKKIHRLL